MPFTLTSRWHPHPSASHYELALTNAGPEPLTDFTLAFSGAAIGIGPHTEIEGGTLRANVSNHVEIASLPGHVLEPGASWRIVLRALAFPLRHWTDGAAGAYLVLADGRTVDVTASPAECAGSDARPRTGSIRYPVPDLPPADLSIIPWPNRIDTTGARDASTGLDLHPETPEAESAMAAFAELVSILFPDEGLVGRPGALRVAMHNDAGLAPESYRIAFTQTGATITAASHAGHLYGLISIAQILRGARLHPGTFIVPLHGVIRDEPAMSWRGTHLDVARQFYSAAEVSRFVAILGWNKLNRLHWHLTDDEAWRLPIDAYPELTDTGALRGHGMAVPPLLGSGPNPTGGAYTKTDIRDIVARAGRFGITVVPEIDIPGHCFALLQALPDLRDRQETGAYQSIQGFRNNCLNPGLEQVHRVLEQIIDETLALFPSGIFHLGADEVPLAAWSGSPAALHQLERLAGEDAADRHRAHANSNSGHEEADAIEGSGTAILQADFIARVHRYLTSKGAITGGWEEAAHGDVLDKSRSYLVGWRDRNISATLASQGYDIVVCPAQRYYLDMALDPDWSEPGAGWAGSSNAAETYSFDPREGWSTDQVAHLLGIQACIWSERMADRAVFDRLVFPRLSAIAESGWTQPERKSWPRFASLCGLMPILGNHWDNPE